MLRLLISVIMVLAVVGEVRAQDFPGYPASGFLQIGQAAAPPAWVPNPGLLIANNLNDLNNVATARANLGLGTLALQNANAVAITGGTITGMPAPTLTGDVANKLYVDSVASGLVVHAAVRLGTVAALPTNVYNNGAAGVGATLTASANAALSVDGTAVVANDRILVKNEATAANNGIYVVTQTGSAGAAYVLTRATDANSAGAGNPNKLGNGSYVLVQAGSVLVNTGWLQNAVVNTIGVDAVNFVQFTGNTTGVSSLNGLTGVLSLAPGGGINITPAGGTITITGAMAPPQGRLTLVSHTPVMVTNQTAKSTLFYDCYRGGSVPVFNGTQDVVLAIPSCEISTALQSSGTGVVNNAGVFDVWAVAVAGVLHLCVATDGSGGGWATDTGGSNTGRGSGYSAIDNATRPYLTNAVALTHCYEGATDRGSVAVNRATYLGSFWTTAAGQTAYTMGASGSPPTPACFCIWNAYSRVTAGTMFSDTHANWNYGSATVREADGINNNGAYRVQAVTGLPDDYQTATYHDTGNQNSTSGGFGGVLVCFNSTTTASGYRGVFSNAGQGLFSQGQGGFSTHASGFNFFSACEAAFGGTSQIFFSAPYSFLEYNGTF